MPITLGDTDITGLSGTLFMPDTTNSSFVGPVIRNYGGDGSIAGLYFQGYDWVQGGIWHGRSATGTERAGALVLGTNPDTAVLSKQGLVGRVIINNAGNVRMPYQPAFAAHGNGSTGYGANTTFVFQTVKHNVGSHYNSSTGVFTAPVAGRYFFYAQMLGDSSGNRTIAYVSLNNSTGSGDQTTEISAYTGAYNSAQGTAIFSLAANDNVRIRNADTNAWYGGSSFQNYFCGFLIG
jgi:hypothetical protein